jgi:exonuclease III
MNIISWNVNSVRAILKKDFIASVKKNETGYSLLAGNKSNIY